MAKCNLCNRNMSITKEGVYRAHTVHKDSKEVCQNSGMPAPDWYAENQIKKQIMGETYQDYLSTEHWKELSAETKRLAGHRCQVCNSKSELHVHHRTYERKGHELQSDVIALCSECHKLFHDRAHLTPRALDAASAATAEPDSGSGIIPAGLAGSQPRQ